MQDPGFYQRHLGDATKPTPCFARGRDLVIPPWKVPPFWKRAFALVTPQSEARRMRSGLVFFAGDLGLNRLPGCMITIRMRTLKVVLPAR